MMRNFFCFILCGTVLMPAFAASDHDLLRKAFDVTKTMNFQATVDRPMRDGLSGQIVMYQLKDPLGNFVYKRIDYIQDDGNPKLIQSTRTNPDGAFLITDKAVIKQETFINWAATFDVKDDLPITSRKTKYRDLSCREITVQVGTTPDARVQKISYLVGKNDFIYMWKALDSSGKTVDQFEFGNVDFNADLSPNLFFIPNEKTILNAKDSRAQKIITPGNPAEEIPANIAKDPNAALLFRALKTTRKTKFKSKRVDYAEGVHYCFYQLPEQDFTFKRMDIITNRTPEVLRKMDLQNKDGYYECNDDTAVLHQKGRIYWPPLDTVPWNVPISKINVTYEGIPCYKLKIRYPSNFLPASEDKELWPFVRVFIIGRENLFIYSWTYYNLNGKKLYNCSFGTVTFDPPDVTPETFDIPKDAKTHETDDHKKTLELLYPRTVPLARSFDWDFSWFWNYSSLISILLAILSGLALVGAITLKKISH